MGGAQSITYAVPVTQKQPGESAVYRSPEYKDKIHATFGPNLSTIKEVLINSFKIYATSPALGIFFVIKVK